MLGGIHWTLVFLIVGWLISLVIRLVDKSEIRNEKFTAVLYMSSIPFCVMMCEYRGGATFIDFLFLTYFVFVLQKALMAIWEYYDPSPK